jgi:peptidoglycan/xylan/chitin deacetylase (PgdA/CDA1 family)
VVAVSLPPPPGPLSRSAPGPSVDGPWLQNHADATLWSSSGADAVSFATIPAFLGRFQRQPQVPPRDARLYVYYPGDTAGVQPGYAWVDAALVGPSGPPEAAGLIERPVPPPLVSDQPRPLPPGGGRLVRRVETTKPLVALTLDDGIDHDALDVLRDRGVKATLFLTGAWVLSRPDTATRALAEGHELANNKFSHPFLTRVGTAGTAREIERASDAVGAVTGAPTMPAFRPPFGDVNAAVVSGAAAEGYDVYLWDVDSGGFRRTATPASAAAVVLTQARAGSIVLMHPLDPADRAALATVIDGLRARGLEPCRLSDLVLSTQS